jgi:hypothetical protein
MKRIRKSQTSAELQKSTAVDTIKICPWISSVQIAAGIFYFHTSELSSELVLNYAEFLEIPKREI